MAIDYRCDDRKKYWLVKRQNWYHLIGHDSLFQKTLSNTPKKNKPSSQEMHLKIQRLGRGLILSNLNQDVESHLFTSL
jgi:hypothetical protein